MKKFRKILAATLVAVLAVSCFAGCGKKNSGGGSGANNIQIAYWNSGLGTAWLDAVAKAFEAKYPEYKVNITATAASNAVVAAFRNEDADNVDLYMSISDFNPSGMEPLDDLLDSKAEGESKTLREKFDTAYLDLMKASDGKTYQLTYGGGATGIVYNKKLFEEAGVRTLPRTTDELASTCDALASSDIKAFCHFKQDGYWEYMTLAWFMQYDGYDYFVNNFYGCTDENGNSPSKAVFEKEDGRYEAVKACEKIITNDYVLTGSNSNDHVTMQTQFLNGDAAMMVNGNWLSNEMASIGSVENFGVMKTPVISSITDKLTTVKKESDLRKVITAIDSVVDGEKDIAEYQKGDDYDVNGIKVSAADWEYVRKARYTSANNTSGHGAWIPEYSDAKEGAKEFLRFLYSDEGLKIMSDTVHIALPLTFDNGDWDTSNWNGFEKEMLKLAEDTEQFATEYIMSRHAIFTEGGARAFCDIKFVSSFCSNNVGDNMTAAQAWAAIQERVDNDYDNTWMANVSK